MTRLPLALFAVSLACLPAPAASPFKDKKLEEAVQKELRLPKADFKDDDLAKLSVLHVNKKGIKDLTGLEKCKGLSELKADNNEISDLKPLKDLPVLQAALATTRPTSRNGFGANGVWHSAWGSRFCPPPRFCSGR